MQRVYTDERFPGFQIENRGTFKFYVIEDGKITGTFVARENIGDDHVSEEYAQKRASDYFERMARMDLSGELDAQSWGARTGEAAPLRKVNPQEVERAMAAARAEQNPERRRELEQRALRLMGREESLAEQTVSVLLYER